jgi:hypothetical protein
MITFDITVAGFVVMVCAFFFRAVADMKREIKENYSSYSDVKEQIALLSYRVKQLEIREGFRH